ncbi:plasmid mobilization protein [Gemmatimonas sp.]|uniref:plasmid mobilization protein n=1 Tax=Gemmatimonas sp. TaxID=1962908 RepID=UPI0039835884
MTAKTAQLQIRVTPQEKAELKRQARAAGSDVSSYVLARVLPESSDRFSRILATLAQATTPSYALAELSDFLHDAAPLVFVPAVAKADLTAFTPYLRNYVAAMVELAAHAKAVAPPSWTASVAPLDAPHFITPLKSLRLHLLRAAPVPFKRRNIFIDSAVGARV